MPFSRSDHGSYSFPGHTLQMINSGILKLAAWSKLPSNRKVYRGLSGMRLPDCFFQNDMFGCRGGVELSFMSTTQSMDVAMQYAGLGVLPILFEIDVGQVDRGASLSWCSQYPGEDEVLLTPMSNLEVIGVPRVEMVSAKQVLIFSLRLNVNLRSPMKEELEARRKLYHMTALANNLLEAERDLRQQVKALAKGAEGAVQKEGAVVMSHILGECRDLVRAHGRRDPAWFNNDVQYRQAIEEGTNMRSFALEMFAYWRDNSEVADYNIGALSMTQVHRMQAGLYVCMACTEIRTHENSCIL